LPGDSYSLANNINDAGDIVGASIHEDFTSFRAVLWRNGQIADLNELSPDSPMSLLVAFSIDAGGAIVGVGLEGDQIHGFLATPDNSANPGISMSSILRPPPVLSENVRRVLLRRFGGRRH
jgi:probable HAF family extracellular repeat protein